MTPCASPQSEITFEDLSKSIIVSQGVQSSSSQNSGSSAQSQSQNQSPPTSPRGGTTQANMAGVDNTLRLPEFKGVGSEDLNNTCLCAKQFGPLKTYRMMRENCAVSNNI
jgi:hypothetical protein